MSVPRAARLISFNVGTGREVESRAWTSNVNTRGAQLGGATVAHAIPLSLSERVHSEKAMRHGFYANVRLGHFDRAEVEARICFRTESRFAPGENRWVAIVHQEFGNLSQR